MFRDVWVVKHVFWGVHGEKLDIFYLTTGMSLKIGGTKYEITSFWDKPWNFTGNPAIARPQPVIPSSSGQSVQPPQ